MKNLWNLFKKKKKRVRIIDTGAPKVVCERCQGFGTVSGLWGMLTECIVCKGEGKVPRYMDERPEKKKGRGYIQDGDIITCKVCEHEFPLISPLIVCPNCGKESWF